MDEGKEKPKDEGEVVLPFESSVHIDHPSQPKVLNIINSENIRIFQGHANFVWCLAQKGNLIFSGSENAEIRVWDNEVCVAFISRTSREKNRRENVSKLFLDMKLLLNV
jgi:hypothetical protein